MSDNKQKTSEIKFNVKGKLIESENGNTYRVDSTHDMKGDPRIILDEVLMHYGTAVCLADNKIDFDDLRQRIIYALIHIVESNPDRFHYNDEVKFLAVGLYDYWVSEHYEDEDLKDFFPKNLDVALATEEHKKFAYDGLKYVVVRFVGGTGNYINLPEIAKKSIDAVCCDKVSEPPLTVKVNPMMERLAVELVNDGKINEKELFEPTYYLGIATLVHNFCESEDAPTKEGKTDDEYFALVKDSVSGERLDNMFSELRAFRTANMIESIMSDFGISELEDENEDDENTYEE